MHRPRKGGRNGRRPDRPREARVPRQAEDTEPGRRRNDGGAAGSSHGGRIGARDKGLEEIPGEEAFPAYLESYSVDRKSVV